MCDNKAFWIEYAHFELNSFDQALSDTQGLVTKPGFERLPTMAQNQLRPEQSQFLTDVRQILLDLSRRLHQDVGDDVVDYALFRLQQLSRHLARFAHAAQVYEEVQADLDMIASLLDRKSVV